MLTTTFARPNVAQLTMPVPDAGHPTPLAGSWALTIILGSSHRVYYYLGLHAPADPSVPVPTLYRTYFGAHGSRQALLARQRLLPAPVVLLATGSRAK